MRPVVAVEIIGSVKQENRQAMGARFDRRIIIGAGNRAVALRQVGDEAERAMPRFRGMKSFQKFASVHASLHNHFNSARHLVDRPTYKALRSAALAEWQALAS